MIKLSGDLIERNIDGVLLLIACNDMAERTSVPAVVITDFGSKVISMIRQGMGENDILSAFDAEERKNIAVFIDTLVRIGYAVRD